MALSIENEASLAHAFKNGINVFCGAAFSIFSKNSHGKNLPTGNELKTLLEEKFRGGEVSNLDLPRLYQVLSTKNKDGVDAFLTDYLRVNSCDERYEFLERLEVRNIITTNIDDLPNFIFRGSSRKYLNDLIEQGSAGPGRTNVDFVPLHGHISHSTSNYVFSEFDLASIAFSDPDRFHFLTERLQKFPTIFLGYALRDAGALRALDPRAVAGRHHRDKWVLLRNPTGDDIDYFKSCGFHILAGEIDDFLTWISSISSFDAVEPTELLPLTHEFPQLGIPSLATVPSRSFSEFFLGAAPSWRDVSNQRLRHLNGFDRAKDAIYAGKNVLLHGTPVCGKTTLLMQLCKDLSQDSDVAFSSGFTKPQMDLYIRYLNRSKRKTIFFIDDFVGLADLTDLLNCEYAQIVCADRSNMVEEASHRLRRDRFVPFDLSEVNKSDYYAYYQSIPLDIREKTLRNPQSNKKDSSIFEFVISNVRYKERLKTRFKSVVSQLRGAEDGVLNMLILAAYLHACRVPASTDVLYHFGAEGGEISMFQSKLRILEGIMFQCESHGEDFYEDQDYYVPRSSVVSEIILDGVSDDEFAYVFKRFHQSISVVRIPNYGLFRRFGYGADFSLRAFKDINEAVDFYERCYLIDENYYILQQCAIYLSRRKDYQRAFQYIDLALDRSRGKVPIIRHTHAVILFDANIGLVRMDPSVREYLDKSLRILKECYEFDRRKSFHAFVFSRQSCQYYDVYKDEISVNYLELARGWLEEELNNQFVKREARFRYAQVKDRLEKYR
ncbi:MAG: SIR2 family protein [Rhizobium rhizophilum]|uniref:SIR2 family protein n=1 Tax=Rhizobium rhizophilum TaxID=1850373 RepID=UPI00391A2C03